MMHKLRIAFAALWRIFDPNVCGHFDHSEADRARKSPPAQQPGTARGR